MVDVAQTRAEAASCATPSIPVGRAIVQDHCRRELARRPRALHCMATQGASSAGCSVCRRVYARNPHRNARRCQRCAPTNGKIKQLEWILGQARARARNLKNR